MGRHNIKWVVYSGFMGTVCVAWFLINLVYIYLHQRRVVSRWNVAYTTWKSGGSAEDYVQSYEIALHMLQTAKT